MEFVFAYSTPHLKIQVAKTLQHENQDFPSELLSETDNIRLQNFTNKAKKLEFLTARLCASAVTGRHLKFDCKANEPPLVERGYLSIAHTTGYAAAAYHTHKKVGIDIELSDRLVKENVQKRYAAENELKLIQNSGDALKLWCAKEAVFKAGHIHGLDFKKNIYIEWNDLNEGTGYIHYEATCQVFSIRQFSVENLLIVYVVEK